MKTSSILAFVPAILFTVMQPATAQDASTGNDAGMQIASKGSGGAAACASCHGAKGEGNPAANFPRIAGQSQAYLAHQLHSFADGSRKSANPVMVPIAKALTPQQIEAVSAYYAGLAAPVAAQAKGPASSSDSKRGETLAARGDNAIKVQACANCHGPGGNGEPPAYPYLAGQQAAYLQTALQEWKTGSRNTDPSGQMPTIAKRLSDGDIASLAAYYAAQPVPPPVGTAIVMRPGTATSGSSGGSSTAEHQGESTPVKGIGSEQGAATGGGSQGPGGGGGASGSGPSGSRTGSGQR